MIKDFASLLKDVNENFNKINSVKSTTKESAVLLSDQITMVQQKLNPWIDNLQSTLGSQLQ